MIQGSGFNPGAVDERIDFFLFEADQPPELVGRKLPLIDKFVQGAQRHAQALCCFVRAQPPNLRGRHNGQSNPAERQYVESVALFLPPCALGGSR